jgi:uncharacterized protein (TIGR03118 family)
MYRKYLPHRTAMMAAGLLFAVLPECLLADVFKQTNLVSDVQGLAAVTDPNLKNPWGISHSATSPYWTSNQASNTSTLYNGVGTPTALVVSIPTTSGSPPHGPTGTVFNTAAATSPGDFHLPNGNAASFFFDTLDGQILGWNGGTAAINVATTAGAIYTGLTNGTVNGTNYLYAANNAGGINVFNASFTNVTATTFAGKFVDPNPVAGFTPFNIQNINGNLYVTYANVPGGVAQPGGYVDEFDMAGNFIKRIATGGPLNAPWGIAFAPANFGDLSGDLLIGNFGNGQILAYNPTTDAFVSTVNGENGQPLVNSGLWALDVRSGGPGVNPNAVYFTAGINGEADGLFGEITAVPEPSELALALIGFAVMAGIVRRRQKQNQISA